MGMANQLGKFSPNLASLTQPLHELLSKNQAWLWDASQEQAFSSVKAELSKLTTLTLYDPAAETKISADASSYGLGVVLLQRQYPSGNQLPMPPGQCQRLRGDTQKLRKRHLPLCDKFSMYVLGKKSDRRRTINHWSHCWAQNSLTASHLECYDFDFNSHDTTIQSSTPIDPYSPQ